MKTVTVNIDGENHVGAIVFERDGQLVVNWSDGVEIIDGRDERIVAINESQTHTAHIEYLGDPSTGIRGGWYKVIDLFLGEEREFVREVLSDAFSNIADGPVYVWFDDEMSAACP